MTSEERFDVLCGCGWGRLGVPESDLPRYCPMCGYAWENEDAE